jgi:hypothetical protein
MIERFCWLFGVDSPGTHHICLLIDNMHSIDYFLALNKVLLLSTLLLGRVCCTDSQLA